VIAERIFLIIDEDEDVMKNRMNLLL